MPEEQTNEDKRDIFLTEEIIKSSGLVMKKDVSIEIETQVTKKLTQIALWIIGAIAFTIIGAIVASLWTMNGDVKEIQGKYASPENIIGHISSRIEVLEKQNIALRDSLHKFEIQKLQAEIDTLKSKK